MVTTSANLSPEVKMLNLRWKKQCARVDHLDFLPGLLRIQAQPPTPFKRALLYILLALFGLLLLWAMLGRLDVVASAEGKLLPQSYLKIVQPSEQGVIRDILVTEGERVFAGQVLMRMDNTLSEADGREIQNDYLSKKITLRRIDAELAGSPFARVQGESNSLYNQVLAQFHADRLSYDTALSQEQSLHDKASSDLSAAREVSIKLSRTLPHYRNQDEAYAKLAEEGFASRIMANDKAREHIEKQQDLKSQEYLIQSAQATLNQSSRRMIQINADYRRQLQTERADISDKYDKLEQEFAKQRYRYTLHELKAPQDGCMDTGAGSGCIVKDLATHTAGTVISPGAILMTLVPNGEILRAEVWVSNQDVGFIHIGQAVKVKLAAYPFQKYGMIEGQVVHISADASDASQQQKSGNALSYRALIDLKAQQLIAKGVPYNLTPGMQLSAEIHLGTRTILEYMLSPVLGAFQEAGRER
jgi:hemolysin D